MARPLTTAALLFLFPCVLFGADRQQRVEALLRDYSLAATKYANIPAIEEPTPADLIRSYQDWPGWKFLPVFVELIKGQPDDEPAFRGCLWIIERTANVGNTGRAMFEADQLAWTTLAKHHLQRAKLPLLCIEATGCDGPAQEGFLRGILKSPPVSPADKLVAAVALGEFLANKNDKIEELVWKHSPADDFEEFLEQRKSIEWGRDLIPENAAKFKTEAIQLFRQVLKQSADGFVPEGLARQASLRLHALEHLTIGAEAPEISGKDLRGAPLRLQDYRGRIVILSFWSTGSSPSISVMRQQRALLTTLKGRPVVMLSVCCDSQIKRGQTTAAAHGATWPTWFDGVEGPIARKFDVSDVPAVFVLDAQGRIAARNLSAEDLKTQVSVLLRSVE